MSPFLDPGIWFDPAGKRVVDLSAKTLELAECLADRGAEHVYAVPTDSLPESSKVETFVGTLWDFHGREIDLAFLDTRNDPAFDFVGDVTRLTRQLQSMLSKDGQAFVILRTGQVHTDWDVYNSVSVTPVGVLPTSPNLFDSILSEFAVRPIKRLPSPAPQYAVDRIFRIAPQKPNLLLILGHSQAGKTTLARGLRKRDRNAHLSSDYLFSELAKMKRTDDGGGSKLLEAIDGASFEDAGKFFRAVEDSEDLLRLYLEMVVTLLPRDKEVVSMDFDLRRADRIDFVKSTLVGEGFSVWLVTR